MAPKRRAGKEAATSTTEAPSPPPVIERPIAGSDFYLFLKPFTGYFMVNPE